MRMQNGYSFPLRLSANGNWSTGRKAALYLVTLSLYDTKGPYSSGSLLMHCHTIKND